MRRHAEDPDPGGVVVEEQAQVGLTGQGALEGVRADDFSGKAQVGGYAGDDCVAGEPRTRAGRFRAQALKGPDLWLVGGHYYSIP